jgi:hypothetical protein
MKHVGKMKNNSARVAVAYRTLPGDPNSCLVIGTQGLGDSYHDTLMNVIESDNGQQANELADILSSRRFPDGSNMLGYLHNGGHLVKVKTTQVNMTPDSQTVIGLDELNKIIAEQKGITLEQLAVSDGSKTPVAKKSSKIIDGYVNPESTTVAQSTTGDFDLSPSELRSRADTLFKQAQVLRKKADELDPPKKKSKESKVIAE